MAVKGKGPIPQGLAPAIRPGGVSAGAMGESFAFLGKTWDSRGKRESTALLIIRRSRASVANGWQASPWHHSIWPEPARLQQGFTIGHLERGNRTATVFPFAFASTLVPGSSAPLAWSLALAAGVLVASIVPLGAARSQSNFTMADIAAPRAMFERLPAWGQRASWAHQNCFEAFVLHAPAVLLCLLVGVSAPWTAAVALAHPLLRLVYIGAYVANKPLLRSLCWASALFCSALLYGAGVLAALAV